MKSKKIIDGLQQDDEARENNIFDIYAEEIENSNGKVIAKPYLKVQHEHILSNVKTKLDGNADMFDVCGDELKKEITTNITKANKSEPVEVGVCRPFDKDHTLLFLEYSKKLGH
jgi:hypothetical protein